MSADLRATRSATATARTAYGLGLHGARSRSVGPLGPVQGREFYYEQQAAQDAQYACQYYGLRWCRVVGCDPSPLRPVIY